jgi:hypothetical protein
MHVVLRVENPKKNLVEIQVETKHEMWSNFAEPWLYRPCAFVCAMFAHIVAVHAHARLHRLACYKLLVKLLLLLLPPLSSGCFAGC